MEKYFSVNEVCGALGVSRRVLIRQIDAGKLPALKIGGQWRISENALNEYIETNTTHKAGGAG